MSHIRMVDGRHRYGLLAIAMGVLTTLPRLLQGVEATPHEDGKASFSERVVAGGADDFVTVRHLRIKGSQRQIGKKLAEIAKDRHRVTLQKTEQPLLRARAEFYRRHYPMHLERGAGVADAFGLRVPESEFDTMMLWFNMEPHTSCSTVYYPGAYTATGHALLSRNYDFSTGTFAELLGGKPPAGARPMNADAYVMEIYPDVGHPSLYICAYDLLTGAMDGVNAAGVTVALLADGEAGRSSDRLMTPQAGLNQLELPRYVLETCADVDEAKAALMAAKQYYLFIPAHFIIGDRSGRSFIWEYGAAHNREYVSDGGGKPQVITNHSVYAYKGIEQVPKDSEASSTYARFIRMQKAIENTQGKHSLEVIKSTNECVRAVENPAFGPPDRTLWHALYDCQDLTLDVDFYLGEGRSPDEPHRRSGYLKFRLER